MMVVEEDLSYPGCQGVGVGVSIGGIGSGGCGVGGSGLFVLEPGFKRRANEGGKSRSILCHRHCDRRNRYRHFHGLCRHRRRNHLTMFQNEKKTQ